MSGMVKRISGVLKKAAGLSIPLILGVITALLWANKDFDSYNKVMNHTFFANVDINFLSNDIFMMFFFGIAAVEIVRSIRPRGNLYPAEKAVTTIFATAGGVIGPVIIFFTLNHLFGSPKYLSGWAIPVATDIAIALLFAKMIFGTKHPAISFLLLLAVLDDAVGMLIIAIFYHDPSRPVQFSWLILVVAAMVSAWFLSKKLNIKSYLPYIAISAPIAWTGLFMAGLHASLALVFIVPFLSSDIPANKKISPIEKFEHDFQLVVDYGLFLFGITNAGIVFANTSSLTLIVLLSLTLGKTLGITGMAKLANKLGFSMHEQIGNKELILVGMVASVGLTVSLFIAGSAYTDINIQGAAKMGALMSIGTGIIAVLLSKLMLRRPKQ